MAHPGPGLCIHLKTSFLICKLSCNHSHIPCRTSDQWHDVLETISDNYPGLVRKLIMCAVWHRLELQTTVREDLPITG